MPETSESRTGTIVAGVFLVLIGDVLLAIVLGVLNTLIASYWPSFDYLFIPIFNTGILGWLWVIPVALWLRHKRPLLVRVMIFTSAVLTLLNAACFGLIFWGGIRIAG